MVRTAQTATVSPSSQQLPISELAGRWRAGDQQAGSEIHARFARQVERTVAMYLNPRFRRRIDVDDVCQIVFRHVFARMRDPDFDFDDLAFLRWLRGVTRNQTIKQIDYMTADRRDMSREVAGGSHLPLEAIIDDQKADDMRPEATVVAREQLEIAVAQLDTDCRIMVREMQRGERRRTRLAAAIVKSDRTVRRNLEKIRAVFEALRRSKGDTTCGDRRLHPVSILRSRHLDTASCSQKSAE